MDPLKARDAGPEPPLENEWLHWCCPYCEARLRPVTHGLECPTEGRWFAREGGVYRLLGDECRRELRPIVEMYERVRRDEGWRLEPGLPEVGEGHRHAAIWRRRRAHFARALRLAAGALDRGSWKVLDAGAGSCWASLRLLEAGHRPVAVDLSLDPEDGLRAPAAFLRSPQALPRAEADLESLPFEPQVFDLVLANGSLHYAPRLLRTLIELRRVTRRGGVLVALDSPVYGRRRDGEAMVEERMARHTARYGVALPRELQSSYLVLDELPGLFSRAGWSASVHGWPSKVRERLRDWIDTARMGRRTARFPMVVARREG